MEAVESGEFRAELWHVGKSRAVQAIFVDEVDTLISPELSEERQARVLEAFANAVIGYTEKMSASGKFKQAIVLVLSFKAEEEIDRIAQSRLGRRVTNTLLTVDLSLTRSDIYEIFRVSAALAAALHRLERDRMPALCSFVNDFAAYFWSDEALARLSIGTALSSALNLAMEFSRALSKVDPMYVNKILASPPDMGKGVENSIKRVLARVAPDLEFEPELKGARHKVSCTLSTMPVKLGEYRADMKYIVRVGGLEVGSCLVEVTVEEELSTRKKRQLEFFGNHYPTILVYFYSEPSKASRLREEVLSLTTDYSVEAVGLPLNLFKYPAALGEAGDEMCYVLSKHVELYEAIRAVLHKMSLALVYEWFALKKVEEARKAVTRAAASEKLSEALRDAVRAALKKIDMASVTRRKLDTIRRHFEATLVRVIPDIDALAVKEAVNDIIARWVEEGLGRATKHYFMRSMAWSDEKAERAAVSVLASLVA